MKPKFACADFTFPLLPHDKVIKLISLLDFEGVDIGLFQDRSHLQPTDQFGDTRKNALALKSKIDDAGLSPADVFLQTALDFDVTAINHPDVKVREHTRARYMETLEYASALGAGHVSILPGVYFPDEAKEAGMERCVAELAWRVGKAGDYGVVLGFEPHIGSITQTPEEVLDLVKAVPGLTLTLDYTHFARVGIPDSRVEPLIPYASHFHARSAALNVLQTVLSESAIDYSRVGRLLAESRYTGYIGIEYIWMEWENANRVDNISEGILMRDKIREAWEGAVNG